jgi:hypothetical protein
MDGCPIDVSKMQPVDLIEGDSVVDTDLLKQTATEAYNFICGQDWCEHVDRQYLAYGVGGVVAVFFFQITPSAKDVDSCLWVIVGDLPPAYLVVDDSPTAADALDGYCSLMMEWVEAVEAGESVDELIPVNASPTIENAEQLKGRLQFLRSEVIPLAMAVG